MADRYLLESSTVDGYLLEDGSGVLLIQADNPPVQGPLRAAIAVQLGRMWTKELPTTSGGGGIPAPPSVGVMTVAVLATILSTWIPPDPLPYRPVQIAPLIAAAFVPDNPPKYRIPRVEDRWAVEWGPQHAGGVASFAGSIHDPPRHTIPRADEQWQEAWHDGQRRVQFPHVSIHDPPKYTAPRVDTQWVEPWHGAQTAGNQAPLGPPPPAVDAPPPKAQQLHIARSWVKEPQPQAGGGFQPPPVIDNPSPKVVYPATVWTQWQVWWEAQRPFSGSALIPTVPDQPPGSTSAMAPIGAWSAANPIMVGVSGVAAILAPAPVIDNPPRHTIPRVEDQWAVTWGAQRAGNVTESVALVIDRPPPKTVLPQTIWDQWQVSWGTQVLPTIPTEGVPTPPVPPVTPPFVASQGSGPDGGWYPGKPKGTKKFNETEWRREHNRLKEPKPVLEEGPPPEIVTLIRLLDQLDEDEP